MKTVACLFLFILSFSVHSAETIIFDESNPPFMYIKDEKVSGFYPKIIEEIFKRMKVPVEMTGMPWQRALNQIENGSAGIAGIYKTKERIKKYDFSEPLFTEKLAVYVKKSASFNYEKIQDLKGKTIGVILGWSLGDDFDQAAKDGTFQTIPSTSDQQNFEKLLIGRIDAVIAIREAGDLFLEKKKTKLIRLDKPIAMNQVFVAFNKKSDKKMLLKEFNKHLLAMKKDGTLKQIIKEQIR